MKIQQFDIIGDIHGYAEQLESLLLKLSYEKTSGVYSHTKRKAVFLGDFIDRGPAQKAVLNIVRPMIDQGYALSVMGNHEFNAICYATRIKTGYIRPHNEKNTNQHQAFLDEYPLGSNEHKEIISWFKSLPVFLDLDSIGIVHACWCQDSFKGLDNFLNPDNSLNKHAYLEYSNSNSLFYKQIERILKGPEQPLPSELYYFDKDGLERKDARISWWKPKDQPLSERLEFSGSDLNDNQKNILNKKACTESFSAPEKPIFIGHYWMKGSPKALSEKVACVDYSVAKGGKMAAYRWSGENTIQKNNFIWV